jgi:hypothetical protein
VIGHFNAPDVLHPGKQLLVPIGFLYDLKIEATYSSETSVDFHRIRRRYIPEDITLHHYYILMVLLLNYFEFPRPPSLIPFNSIKW